MTILDQTEPRMTIRQRSQALANGTPTKPPKKQAESLPVLHCLHRSLGPIGKIKCSCRISPEVFSCADSWVTSGYCFPVFTPDKSSDGEIVLHDGSRIAPRDDRRKTFWPWPLKNGEQPRSWEIIVCSSCPHRVEPPPHIMALRKLGIQGDFDPDTGHADIVHCLTKVAAWSGHSEDWVASSCGLRSVSVVGDKATDLAQIIEATGCRLLVAHTTWCDPKAIEAAAAAFPSVRFLGVLHGSQNSMILASGWSQRQAGMLDLSKRAANVWYGTPEPTVPFSDLGFERYQQWQNTLAVDVSTELPPVVDPVTILIAGRDENIKGLPAAVLAAGVVNRKRPVQVVACVKGNVAPLAILAASVDVPFESKGFLSTSAFRVFVRQSVSIMVNPSLTDAWQYTGLDVLVHGRPVVGSQTIRYLPRDWQADPNDPSDIARVALMFLDDYERYSTEALRLGCEIRDRQQAAYHRLLERILA